MELINRLIMAVDEAGLRNDAYKMINMIAFAVAVILGFLHGVKLKTGIITTVLTISVERILSGPLATFILFVQNGFVQTGQANNVVTFAFIPLMGFLVSKILKKPYQQIWDIMMPVPLIMFAGARIACTITGCCRGYPWIWGVYNATKQEILFPIQLVESIVTILILFAVFRREKKNRFVPDGRNVPIILISYGIARFFLEFLHDNKKIILGCAATSFHCLFMILVGVIALIVIKRSEDTVAQSQNRLDLAELGNLSDRNRDQL